MKVGLCGYDDYKVMIAKAMRGIVLALSRVVIKLT